MSEKTYRVIQWMTGDVGQVGVRHFSDNPTFDLVAVLVHDKEKVGKDAGEIAGIPPTGVIATDDVEDAIARSDCGIGRRAHELGRIRRTVYEVASFRLSALTTGYP